MSAECLRNELWTECWLFVGSEYCRTIGQMDARTDGRTDGLPADGRSVELTIGRTDGRKRTDDRSDGRAVGRTEGAKDCAIGFLKNLFDQKETIRLSCWVDHILVGII